MRTRQITLGIAYTRGHWMVSGRLHWRRCPFSVVWRGCTDPFQPFQFETVASLTHIAAVRLAQAGLQLETLTLAAPWWDTNKNSGYETVVVTVSRLRRPHERAVAWNRRRQAIKGGPMCPESVPGP